LNVSRLPRTLWHDRESLSTLDRDLEKVTHASPSVVESSVADDVDEVLRRDGGSMLIVAFLAAFAWLAGDGDINPCALVTRREAAAAVGAAVGEGKSTVVDTKGNPGLQAGGSCVYESSSSVRYLKLNVYRYPPQVAAIYGRRCAQKEQASGLGVVACWYDARHTELQLLKGNTSLAIQLQRTGDATEPLKTIAKIAVERLP
jgi:hypothetical protein